MSSSQSIIDAVIQLQNVHIDGLAQASCNFIVNALGLCDDAMPQNALRIAGFLSGVYQWILLTEAR